MRILFLAVVTLALAASPALAADPKPSGSAAYRCTVDGQVHYGDRPCTTGAQQTLDPVAAPSAADSAAAKRRAQADEAALQRLVKQRVTSEQQAKSSEAKLAGERWKQHDACRKLAVRSKRAQEDVRAADAKNTPRAKTRARRVEEDYAALCR